MIPLHAPAGSEQQGSGKPATAPQRAHSHIPLLGWLSSYTGAKAGGGTHQKGPSHPMSNLQKQQIALFLLVFIKIPLMDRHPDRNILDAFLILWRSNFLEGKDTMSLINHLPHMNSMGVFQVLQILVMLQGRLYKGHALGRLLCGAPFTANKCGRCKWPLLGFWDPLHGENWYQ